jgi:solute:Na+ symporter, SSS family
LLEAANRLVNLLVAPLFVLFFMAMFVRWATPFGTWAAGLSSVAAAAIIAYTDLTPLSFLWIMPGSLATGVIVGCLVSAIPITKRRPMLERQ